MAKGTYRKEWILNKSILLLIPNFLENAAFFFEHLLRGAAFHHNPVLGPISIYARKDFSFAGAEGVEPSTNVLETFIIPFN